MIMSGSSFLNFIIPDSGIVSLHSLSIKQMREPHMFFDLKKKSKSCLPVYRFLYVSKYLFAGLFLALLSFQLRKTLIVFFYLAVVIPQLVFP